MKIFQKTITIKPKPRGFHIIDDEILDALPNIREFKVATLTLLLQHTSASLSLGENYEKEVRDDLESFVNLLAPENSPYFTHTLEGSDDMPAHIKSTLIGVNLTLPITDGKLNLGTWQGIYLGEHRDFAGSRKIVATIYGI
jgi:secondary thiamine-phosphate synthase enzyme